MPWCSSLAVISSVLAVISSVLSSSGLVISSDLAGIPLRNYWLGSVN